MRVLTARQMREADAAAVARIGEVALMRAAGVAIAALITEIVPERGRIVAVAGPGNNGGDAFAALAELSLMYERIIYTVDSGDAARRPVGAGRADAELRASEKGVVVRPLPTSPDAARAALATADLALDALLGVGGRIELAPPIAAAVSALSAADVPLLAVDVPTGVDATTGAVGRVAVRAQATIALGALKTGLLREPGRAQCGRLFARTIGIEQAIAAVGGERVAALDPAEFRTLLPRRGETADKRLAGAPLIVAGSPQFPGAAILCARGAARAGAGYVTVATAEAGAAPIRGALVEQVVVTYDDRDVDGAIETLLGLTSRAGAVGLGPGLGLSDATGAIVRGFLAALDRPCVIDAGGLFHLAKHLELLRGKAAVLTPHASEFARLSGEGTIAPGTREARLRAFVARTGIVTLLKGPVTLVDDGTTLHANLTGTPALATAGTGDVLTGVIATLLAQGLRPVDAARVGAYWHGLAGRHAARDRPIGVVAGDVADSLGAALRDRDDRS